MPPYFQAVCFHLCSSSAQGLYPERLSSENRNNNNSTSSQSNTHKKDSFLWMIETKPPSYFFGTIHVPYTRVWDAIPDNMKQAFAASKRVFFELDLTKPHVISSLSACQLLPNNRHLSQEIPSDLYARLKIHMEYVRTVMPNWVTKEQKRKGIDADYLFSAITANWERKRPIWVTLLGTIHILRMHL